MKEVSNKSNTMSPTREIGRENVPVSYKLEFEEQPVQEFRFRYLSEFKKGSHGCLKSERGKKRKDGGFPTVRTNFYTEEDTSMFIQIGLYTATEPKRDHVHKLVYGSKTDLASGKIMFPVTKSDCTRTKDWSFIELKFLNILHMGKDEVEGFLKDQFLEEKKISHDEFDKMPQKQRKKIDEELKERKREIENAVILGVEVYNNGNLVVGPCYSTKISNTKTAKKLNIEDISKVSGSCSGGDEVFIFCDKLRLEDIDKIDPERSDITVEFYEINANDSLSWKANAKILKIHHQAAMKFETPPYKDREIHQPVEVCMKLVRKSDNEASEPRIFTYEPVQNNLEPRNKKLKTSHPSDHNQQNENSLNKERKGNENMETAAANGLLLLSNCDPLIVDSEETDLTDLNAVGSVDYQTFNELMQYLQEESFSNYQLQQNFSTEFQELNLYPSHQFSNDLTMYPSTSSSSNVHCTEVNTSMNVLYSEDRFGVSIDSNPLIPVLQNDSQFLTSEQNSITNDLVPLNNMYLNNEPEVCCDPSNEQYLTNKDSDPMVSGFNNDLEYDCDVDCSAQLKKLSLAEENNQILDKPQKDQSSSFSKYKLIYKLALQFARYSLKMKSSSFDLTSELKDSNNTRASFFNYQMESLKYFLKVARSFSKHTISNLFNELLRTTVLLNEANEIRELLRLGANPNYIDRYGNTAIHLAAQQRTDSCLTAILDTNNTVKYMNNKCNLNAYNFAGYTPLHLAVLNDSFENVKHLFSAGSNIDLQDRKCGRTALHIAVQKRNIRIIHFLLENCGPNRNLQMYNGDTPFDLTLMQSCYEVEKLFNEDKNVSLWENKAVYDNSNESKKGLIRSDLDQAREMLQKHDLNCPTPISCDSIGRPTEQRTKPLAEIFDQNTIEKLKKCLDCGYWRHILKLMKKEDLVSVVEMKPSPAHAMMKCILENEKDIFKKCLEQLQLDIKVM